MMTRTKPLFLILLGLFLVPMAARAQDPWEKRASINVPRQGLVETRLLPGLHESMEQDLFDLTLTGPDGRVFVGSNARQFVMVGICGGYTTFSAFSLQTLNLANDGEWLHAGANVTLSVVLCLIAVWIGHALAAGLNTMKWI